MNTHFLGDWLIKIMSPFVNKGRFKTVDEFAEVTLGHWQLIFIGLFFAALNRAFFGDVSGIISLCIILVLFFVNDFILELIKANNKPALHVVAEAIMGLTIICVILPGVFTSSWVPFLASMAFPVVLALKEQK